MVDAQDFQSFTASVFPSQEVEVTLAKQPALSAHGREVRLALSQMPPEVTRDLLSTYAMPSPETVAAMESTIMQRELSIDNASKEVNLDKEWLAGGAMNRRMDEVGLGSEDEWNIPEGP